MKKKALIIEKRSTARDLLLQLLNSESWQSFSVDEGHSALDLLKNHSIDLIFSDLKGIECLQRFNKFPTTIPIVYLSTEEGAKLNGIQGVLTQPFDERAFKAVLQQVWAPDSTVIAVSPQFQRILHHVKKIATSHSNVFITGESGTGKEVIASLIHAYSKRASAPFVRVNCAALPQTLIESEFFGHEKGAFTGALQRHSGRFERADLGTLLLDEVSEIPQSLQAKLLRVVQEQEFERVGGNEVVHVDVRLIATSNRDMKEATRQKVFRDDLYYRLNVIPIHLPPLRERIEDIVPLSEHFLKDICLKNQLPLKTFSAAAKHKLLRYDWPGNIRELRNVIEHSIVVNESELIEASQLPIDVAGIESEVSTVKSKSLKAIEKEHIMRMLELVHGHRTQAAQLLGVSVRTLRNKLKRYQQESGNSE